MADSPIDRAERVAQLAAELGIATVVIGAYALAAHHYVRGTRDIDLATDTKIANLRELEARIRAAGYQTEWRDPDDEDPLGGVLVVWLEEDAEGDPIYPLEIVNFDNPFRPRLTPATRAIRDAIALAEKPLLRFPRLGDLIALKLYAGGGKSKQDVIELLVHNPDADLEEIRQVAKSYKFDHIDQLIDEALARRRS